MKEINKLRFKNSTPELLGPLSSNLAKHTLMKELKKVLFE